MIQNIWYQCFMIFFFLGRSNFTELRMKMTLKLQVSTGKNVSMFNGSILANTNWSITCLYNTNYLKSPDKWIYFSVSLIELSAVES